MALYSVSLPVTLHLAVMVEADSESAAIETAFGLDWSLNVSGEGSPEIIECEAHRQVVTGNVYHGVLNKAEAQADQ